MIPELQVDGVVAYASDPAAPTAAYVCEKLGLPTSPYTSVEILSQKDLFRRYLAEHNFNVPKYVGCTSYTEALEEIKNLTLPVMIKPVDSSGSKGINKLTNVDQLKDFIEDALSYSREKRIIIEEFIEKDGYQISGDAFSVDGILKFHCFGNEYYSSSVVKDFAPLGECWPFQMKPEIITELEKDIQRNGDPIKGILLSIVAGAIAGSVTGILITKLNVQPILAGIITMTALYSINLKIMDRPNISLYKKDTIFTMAQKYFGDYYKLAAAGIVLVIAAVLLFWFLKTQAGMSLRATGDNEYMVRASSINSDRMKIMGFAIANALVSLSGAMYAQYSSAGDSNSGTGMLVVGLASIIIGEIFFSKHSILCGILAAIFGAIAYRFVLAFAMNLGMDSNYTKLFSACIVALAISLPAIKKYITKAYKRVCSDK